MQQEIFPFHKVENLNWNDFVMSEENLDAVSSLTKWPQWITNGLIIHGEPGTGKTHLAALWAQSANAIYVLNESLKHNTRDLFQNNCNFVIDNFENFLTTSNYAWLFDFLNIAKEKNRSFLILAKKHPQSWGITLKDLSSRIFTIPCVKIHQPNDELLLKIAQKISKDLQISIQKDVLQYLLNFIPRDVKSIWSLLKTLDQLSMQKHKSINLAFVKNYLNTNVF